MSEDYLNCLYERYGTTVYARCRRMLHSPAAAEDAAQETFLRVHQHLEAAPRNEEALYWICRIATNYCLNEIRRQKTHAKVEEQLPTDGDLRFSEERIADRDLVHRIVARAPEQLRAAAWLYHVDGLDQAEVADALRVSRRTIVNYLASFEHLARKYILRTSGPDWASPELHSL